MRLDAGMSQEAFADRVGFDRTYISGIERGVRNPTVVIVAKIAVTLGTTAGALLDPPHRKPR